MSSKMSLVKFSISFKNSFEINPKSDSIRVLKLFGLFPYRLQNDNIRYSYLFLAALLLPLYNTYVFLL